MADADELLKKAGGFFSKVGNSIKQTSKQVTGLGRGSVRVVLERTRFAPGETVRGNVLLAFPEAVEAKRLVVSLLAHQRSVELAHRDGSRTTLSKRNQIFHFDSELGSAQAFTSRTIAFELVVPPDALDKQAPAGGHPIADAVRSVASALGPQIGPVEWSVAARLEIAWGRDLGHEVDVVIAR